MGQLYSTKPLQFHEVHGGGVLLSEDKTVARCAKVEDDSFLFSRHPIKANQKTYMKLTTTLGKSHDVISLGFTSQDPSSLSEQQLPKCDSYELDNKPGYWLCTLSKYFFLEDVVLCFHFDESGNIHYGVHEKRKYTKLGAKMSMMKNQAPLWAVFRIWSAPTVVKLSDSPVVLSNMTSSLTSSTSCINKARLIAFAGSSVKKDVHVSTSAVDGNNPMCVICFVEVADTALYPCGHLCMCGGCAQQLWGNAGDGHCPICRRNIIDLLKIYK